MNKAFFESVSAARILFPTVLRTSSLLHRQQQRSPVIPTISKREHCHCGIQNTRLHSCSNEPQLQGVRILQHRVTALQIIHFSLGKAAGLVQMQLKLMSAWKSLVPLLKRLTIQCKVFPKRWKMTWEYIKSVLWKLWANTSRWEMLWITRILSSRCDSKIKHGVIKVLGRCSSESFQSD